MKGLAVIWLSILFGIFLIGVVYIITSRIIYTHIEPFVNPLLGNSSINTTSVRSNITLLDTAWQYILLIVLMGLMLFGIMSAQKRDPGDY